MSKSAVARSDAEWIWETYASSGPDNPLGWLDQQLENVVHRSATAEFLLQRAVEANDASAIALLLARGTRVGGYLMYLAICRQNAGLLRQLIAAGGNVNEFGMEGPILFDAIATRKPAIVSLLLDLGADLELACGIGTPLMKAAALGDHQMVELLLVRGANPAAFYDGDTPESVARSSGHDDLAERLHALAERRR